jgi:hypothetical protein
VPEPTHPDVIHRHDAAIHGILAAWRRAYTRARCGPLSDTATIRNDAVAALLQGRILVDVVTARVSADRWDIASVALHAGAPLGDIATALDLPVEEVCDELAEWTHEQYALDLLSPSDRDRVLDIVDGETDVAHPPIMRGAHRGL